jgi:anthranilate synthase/aminodeoxychorismate synthase-like glutamine amidotransferase
LILLLDNKDSFVWNLAQALQKLGAEVDVVRSDAVAVDAIGSYRAVVLSPGPGRPDDAGRCLDVVRRWSGERPLLGVCLGHQTIAQAFGAEIVRGEPVHGRPTPIHHDGTGVFADLPQPLLACRYHSLYVPRTLPDALRATAHSDAGEVMAVQHRTHPTHGVQFHPESFRTEHGERLLGNFLREAAA